MISTLFLPFFFTPQCRSLQTEPSDTALDFFITSPVNPLKGKLSNKKSTFQCSAFVWCLTGEIKTKMQTKDPCEAQWSGRGEDL